jgi:hypothetical protein
MMEQGHIPVEKQIRHRLGIPNEAERVLIFSESSHWDPDWILTSEEYFERFVRHNLNGAIDALQKEPRRIYSVECMFFLRMYWDQFPEQREIIRDLINNRRIRLTSSGVTTADTLLPSAEAILRDFLIGQEWLRKNGMTQEPKLAYFTDSFGCTPALPSLLNGAGFDRTAITRLDGMYFMGCDLESSKRFPRKGSSAERLQKQERSLDFIWRDNNGARLLCHWNAFSYGQGDMLAYIGISRVYLARLAIPSRSDRHIAGRIKQYLAQLSPYARTPYMLCPIGFDFVEPIPDLVSLLDRYNQNHYPKTGVWAINAGLDDYLALIEPYQDRLPVLELDPNPYWTGFYTARPTLKQRSRELVNNLLLAEKLSFLPENRGAETNIASELEDAWWRAVVSNHHDYITGTSPDRVAEVEQIPWLDHASDSVNRILEHLSAIQPTAALPASATKPVAWSRENGRIQIKTVYYDIELAEAIGGVIVKLCAQGTQTPLLIENSNELVSYRDSGGLWRMGLEFAGGFWKESMWASQHPSQMEIYEHDNGLEILNSVDLDRETFLCRIWVSNNSPLIRFRVEGKAAEGHSVTVRYATNIRSKTLWMDTAGGMVERPPQWIYNPTFWPLHHFVHIQGDDGRGLAIIQAMPGAVSYQPDGQLELVAMRNATREKAFGWLGIPGNPAVGHERDSYAYEYALLFTENGNWQENNLPLQLQETSNSPWRPRGFSVLRQIADSIITTDNPNVWIAAVKAASRGEGIIVRLNALAVPESTILVRAHHFKVTKAFLCDARERDLSPLEVKDGAIRVKMQGTVTTIRLIMDQSNG